MPLSLIAIAVLTSVDWNEALKNLATDADGKTAKSLLTQLKPDERARSAKQAVDIFTEDAYNFRNCRQHAKS